MTPAFRVDDVRGARIAWNQTGRGPAAIWAHGLGSSAYRQELSGEFDWRAVSSTRRLIRYDARGHGRSTGGTAAHEYTWPELGADLLGLLDVAAPGDPVDAIGASMGAATIVYAALAQPDRFRSLVLVTPPTIWGTRRVMATERLEAADLIDRHGLAAFERGGVDEPVSPALADARRFVAPIAVRASIFPWVLRGAAESDLPAPSVLASLGIPALVLSWTGDHAHPVSSGELLADTLPTARLTVADTRHQLRSWPQVVAAFLDNPFATAL